MEIKVPIIPGNKPGTVGKILVNKNEEVSKDQELAYLETTKGNRIIKAPMDGIIQDIHFNVGDEVLSNVVLFELKEVQAEIQEVENSLEKEEIKSDLLIIGAGPGGYVAAIYAAKNGLKVTLVEKDELGGTCLNRGCIPTKALVKSSEVYHEAKTMDAFGLKLEGSVHYDMNDLILRKDGIVDTLVSGIASLIKKNKIQYIKGEASFISQDEVKVLSEKEYHIFAKDTIIATGSKISRPPFAGLDLACVLDSTSALDYKENLESITIIGGGVIGMEFACIFNNLGVKVNVVEFQDRLLSVLDEDITSEFERLIQEKGIQVHTASAVSKIQMSEDQKAIITYKHKDAEHLLVTDKVLVATGREPNIEGLNLEVLNLTMNPNKKSILVDEYMQTSLEHIYAIGDVTNIIQLAHVASHQGMVAVDAILNKKHKMQYNAVPNVIFTSPEIASVGLSEAECKALKRNYTAKTFFYEANGKALTMNATEGFVKLIAEDNQLIGASIIGIDASSLISTLTLAITNHLSIEEITHTIFAHPTTSEVIHEAALDFTCGSLHQ